MMKLLNARKAISVRKQIAAQKVQAKVRRAERRTSLIGLAANIDNLSLRVIGEWSAVLEELQSANTRLRKQLRRSQDWRRYIE
jgi:hypothetical protein